MKLNIRQPFIFLFSLLVIVACNKEQDLIYELNEFSSIPVSADKNKIKSPGQYLAILHANLFQRALSANQLVELGNIVTAFGDKDVIHEVIIGNLMNRPGVILPADSMMRNNMDEFLIETFKRFFVRPPTELEKTFLTNYIKNNPAVTPEIVYFSFSLSNEYQFF